jgi:cytidylate kinase
MAETRALIVAIDGPSGAGKGTVARTLAAQLAYRHVDTGAMYRAVAWRARMLGLDLGDGEAVADVARRAELEVNAVTRIDGHDVTEAIRTPDMDRAAAIVAQHPQVRTVLVARQRDYGRGGGIIMEGRDIGTVVFPAADVKVYLDAAPEERARRRSQDAAHASRLEPGASRVAEALAERDRTDRTRSTSPLTIAPDAVYIDTTHLSIDAVVERVLALVDARAGTVSHGAG